MSLLIVTEIIYIYLIYVINHCYRNIYYIHDLCHYSLIVTEIIYIYLIYVITHWYRNNYSTSYLYHYSLLQK